jgi:hypothetical protein
MHLIGLELAVELDGKFETVGQIFINPEKVISIESARQDSDESKGPTLIIVSGGDDIYVTEDVNLVRHYLQA